MDKKSNLMKGFDVIAALLLVIGGLNWGMVGLFGQDVVASLLGSMSPASRLVFGLVGLAALYEVVMWRAIQRRWGCELWPRPAQRTAA